jgi:sugar (pentulose or hexulose) kinase
MFLGLDFGTSGARACAVCKDKSVAWELRVDYPDAEKQTPRDWRSALLSLLSALPREVAANLQGIAIAGLPARCCCATKDSRRSAAPCSITTPAR